MLETLRDRVRGMIEVRSLLVLMVLAGGALAFGSLASEVVEGDTAGFDRAVLLALRSAGDLNDPIGPLWLEEFVRDVSGLGGVGILSLVTLAAVVLLWLMGNGRTAVFLAVSVTSGSLMSSVFKALIDRPRPDLVPHGSYVSSASFPSGHSMMSAVVYLTLAVMLARTQERLRVRLYLLSVATILTLGVGGSRVYLGVHWPTDVLAGWCLGATWAVLCAVTAAMLGRTGQIEHAAPGAAEEAAE